MCFGVSGVEVGPAVADRVVIVVDGVVAISPEPQIYGDTFRNNGVALSTNVNDAGSPLISGALANGGTFTGNRTIEKSRARRAVPWRRSLIRRARQLRVLLSKATKACS